MNYRNTLLSATFFLKLIFVKRRYDVVFIYRNTFVREGGENLLLKPFIEVCKKKNYRYLLLESRHYQEDTGYQYLENKEAVPFNFINYLRMKLRRFVKVKHADTGLGDEWIEREKRIGKVLYRLFLRNLETKLFITLVGYEHIAFLKFIYPDITFAEYQHGVFWCTNDNSSQALSIFRRSLNEQTYYLTFGKGFHEVSSRCPLTFFFPKKNLKEIGYYGKIPEYQKYKHSKTILYTLQNVDMASNSEYYSSIKDLISENARYIEESGYKIIFKNHPRYDRNEILTFEEKYPFVSFVEDEKALADIKGIFLHITSKSTTAFDAALHSIPTIFIDLYEPRSPKKIFFDQYHYPLEDFIVTEPVQLSSLLKNLDSESFYFSCSKKVYLWARKYYQDFDENVFIDLLDKRS